MSKEKEGEEDQSDSGMDMMKTLSALVTQVGRQVQDRDLFWEALKDATS